MDGVGVFSMRVMNMNKKLRIRLLFGATAVWLAAMAGASADVRTDVSTRQSVRASAPGADLGAGSYVMADLFGESEEEKAERLRLYQQEQSQNSSISYLRQRNDDLENTVRRLTGQIEQLGHRIDEQNARIERMQKDFDYRLCALAAQQLGTVGGGDEASALNCSPSSGAPSAAPPAAPPVAPAPPAGRRAAGEPVQLSPPPRAATDENGESVQLGRPPGTLGSLPVRNAPAAPAAVPSAGNANRSKFDSAMRLLAKAQYDEARSAFRGFADAYPKDDLAPQALYWIGDIALVQKDYAGAARAFAEEIKKYPDSARSPDSMLKLGQSLIAMGQKQEGCTALAALPTKYPDAAKTVIAHAAADRKSSRCH
jgi:tol-pal system protein YbgF